MIGIVIVSHSKKLAEGVVELVDQMTQGQVPLIAAGGIDDPQNPIGTDAIRILDAIESVFSTDGVLVLMDMGSALLSAETALDFLSDEHRAAVRLCSAPLVEGAMAAAVQATATINLDEIVAEAQSALLPKASQLGDTTALTPADTAAVVDNTAKAVTLTIRNQHGLHARPAARFVSTAGRFEAQITIRDLDSGKGPVNAKSINQVATLGAGKGHRVVVVATGPDAVAALSALEQLAAANFGEAETTHLAEQTGPPTVTVAAGNQPAGIAVSPGIAIGPAAVYRPAAITVTPHTISDPQAEQERLDAAIQKAKTEIAGLYRQAKKVVGGYEAAIFEAHQLFLGDPTLVNNARATISTEKINAEAAWQRAVDKTVADYRALGDEYLQARADDVNDVGRRVLKLLAGVAPPALNFEQPVVLVARDLAPSDTAQLNPQMVLGLCTELGSATSHSAILARALGIPAVVGLGETILHVTANSLLALDGATGQIWVNPDRDTHAELQRRRRTWLAQVEQAQVLGKQPAHTADGVPVEVVANIGGLNDVRVAMDAGAEGVGLFRTEFLYLDRTTPPTEDEQAVVYRSVAQVVGQRPLVFRTLDIGGDKPVPYLDVEPEENPFLGWRGIRMTLDRPEMLKTQLRAILQASPGHRFKIMFPMISNATEVQAAKSILAGVQAELRTASIPFDPDIEVGIMVEVPAAAATADVLARHVDFFSIGTNDLSQYTMAADRTNPNVATLPNPFQPAVLRLIRQTIEAAHAAGIWVGLCGEFAGSPLAAPLLLGLGLDEFSMSAPAIPAVKQNLARFTVAQAQTIATEALTLDSAQAVRDFLQQQLEAGAAA